jgi:hypothetical protein
MSAWKPIIVIFRNRLSMWRGKLLGMARRICLIKRVSQGFLPSFREDFYRRVSLNREKITRFNGVL